MNSNIELLYQLASQKERLIIGLMSGTSLDGLDIALCLCKGSGMNTIVEVLNFCTIPYEVSFKEDIKTIFAKRNADLESICLLNEYIGITHGQLVLSALKKWGLESKQIDLIASHGQTIFHAPKSLHQRNHLPNGTLQIGDGDHIAVQTGIITVSDFRQKHLAAGGEGAPLAVYGDYLIFSKQGEDRIMLNIGGISNFTYLPSDQDAAKVFSTDVGPGNTIMDHFIQSKYPDKYFDEGGAMARNGSVNQVLLDALLANDFFNLPLPKTTGPELFSLSYLQRAQALSNTLLLNDEDVLATLCAFTASAIINAIKKTDLSNKNLVLYVSGGGMHNPIIMENLKSGLPNVLFKTTADINVNPDAKEAVLFAVLANETIAGNPINFGNRKGVPSVCMGKISLPH